MSLAFALSKDGDLVSFIEGCIPSIERIEERLVIVTYEGDWADEITVTGTRLFTVPEWDELIRRVEEYFSNGGELSKYIGSNQTIYYNSFKEWRYCYKEMPVHPEYADMVKVLYSNSIFNNAQSKHFYYPELEDE
ncbi:hypothetical protein H6G33_09955 [Calothrix sp. FACHB-1219]|uniref:hypothetical protein n=1 Tax=unclassified Calothrix TaxID=2619626 RepID=UPI001684DC4A|nr:MULTISPECIES: hypothetical protein [unclassified Calothrix]MBD2201670.1 hypothetical protein [Calothrix sp. FACHB-168]MBD2217356.1 hypothetical protein [Calothrix sp. FACHB-1219]